LHASLGHPNRYSIILSSRRSPSGHWVLRVKWKLAFGHVAGIGLRPLLLGAEAPALMLNLGFDGSKDFATEANPPQPAGPSFILRIT
jgi:hypothetical protein